MPLIALIGLIAFGGVMVAVAAFLLWVLQWDETRR